mmetsp:Transcript_19015/g.28910  ORF Transcript_19015/g.28910 Transcript_19015/m.28910 type:complete len:88 (-) Transcript_19015:612-875(-)
MGHHHLTRNSFKNTLQHSGLFRGDKTSNINNIKPTTRRKNRTTFKQQSFADSVHTLQPAKVVKSLVADAMRVAALGPPPPWAREDSV